MIPRTFSELHQLVMDASRDPQDSEEALPKRKFLQELTDDQLRACFTELESKSSGDDEVLQDSLTMIQNFFGTARAWVPTVFDRLTKCIPPLWLQTRVPDFPTLLFLITRPNFAEEQSAIFTILGREHLLKLLNQEIVPTEKKPFTPTNELFKTREALWTEWYTTRHITKRSQELYQLGLLLEDLTPKSTEKFLELMGPAFLARIATTAKLTGLLQLCRSSETGRELMLVVRTFDQITLSADTDLDDLCLLLSNLKGDDAALFLKKLCTDDPRRLQSLLQRLLQHADNSLDFNSFLDLLKSCKDSPTAQKFLLSAYETHLKEFLTSQDTNGKYTLAVNQLFQSLNPPQLFPWAIIDTDKLLAAQFKFNAELEQARAATPLKTTTVEGENKQDNKDTTTSSKGKAPIFNVSGAWLTVLGILGPKAVNPTAETSKDMNALVKRYRDAILDNKPQSKEAASIRAQGLINKSELKDPEVQQLLFKENGLIALGSEPPLMTMQQVQKLLQLDSEGAGKKVLALLLSNNGLVGLKEEIVTMEFVLQRIDETVGPDKAMPTFNHLRLDILSDEGLTKALAIKNGKNILAEAKLKEEGILRLLNHESSLIALGQAPPLITIEQIKVFIQRRPEDALAFLTALLSTNGLAALRENLISVEETLRSINLSPPTALGDLQAKVTDEGLRAARYRGPTL